MEKQYEIIDEKNWKRAAHCDLYRNALEPCYCITVELDVSTFLMWVKERGYSYTMALIYIVTKCADEIEEFRYRFVDNQVVLFEKIHTSFTYLNEDSELFKVVQVPMQDTIEEYVKIAKKAADDQKDYFTGPLADNVFQFSAIPWISYTHISHTITGNKSNGMPVFDWGKYHKAGGKWVMPFSIQVHHSFVDGVHVGRLVAKLQSKLYEYHN